MKNWVLIFSFLLITSLEFSSTTECSIANDTVYCDKFDSFSSVYFNAYNVSSITLIPNRPLILNQDLNFQNITFVDYFKFTIKNLLGFDLFIYPLKDYIRTGHFYLNDSTFEFFSDGNPINQEQCNYILNNELYLTFFDYFDYLIFGSNVTYSKQLCPGIFKSNRLKSIEFHQLTNENKLQFAAVNYSSDLADLNCSIEKLKISNSIFYLEEKLLDKEVFKNLTTLTIDNSNLIGIQDDLFMFFSNLKRIELNLNNFNDFIKTSSKWFSYLNDTNINSSLVLVLNDLTSTYDYPESDFCLFKNFPHSDSIKPIILTKPDLECTCTLMWLLKNKNQYAIDQLSSNSTIKCLNNSNFDQLIIDCNFDERLEGCMGIDYFCSFTNNSINCTNFDNFYELDFSNITNTYQLISLSPKKQILFDDTLDFKSIKFDQNFHAFFKNIKGFDMEINPFALQNLKNGTLILDNSMLNFYFRNDLIDASLCELINQNELFVAFFDVYKSVTFESQVKYPKQFCPIQFKNARLDVLKLKGLTSGNLLSFINIAINNEESQLNSAIDTLDITSSEIYLNKKIFYNEVFKNTRSLLITTTTLLGIDYSLFIDFYLLKFVELNLVNFDFFIQTDQTWMKYLNSNISVNLSNQNEISINKDNRMFLTLEDNLKFYKYPEEHFCLFRNFPHGKLVFPIIKTANNLECTCTLMYLIKNRNLYPDLAGIMETSSVSTCLNSPMFTQMISNCNFDSKLAVCNGITTTTLPISTNFISSTTQFTSFTFATTEVIPNDNDNNNVYKGLFISFLFITIILLLGIGIAIFILFKIRKPKEFPIVMDEID